MQLKGTIDKVFKPGKTWSSVLIISDGGQYYKAAGSISMPSVGMRFILDGVFEETEKYGRQFKVESSMRQDTGTSIARYLTGNIKGIGEKTAQKIVEKFGTDALDIMNTDPDKLLDVKGISPKKLEKIKASNGAQDTQKNRVLREIHSITNGGLTDGMVTRIYDALGDDAPKILAENPYILIEKVPRIGFLTADRIAQISGLKGGDPRRIDAAVVYALQKASEEQGHCFLHSDELLTEALDVLFRKPTESGNQMFADAFYKKFCNYQEQDLKTRENAYVAFLKEYSDKRNVILNTQWDPFQICVNWCEIRLRQYTPRVADAITRLMQAGTLIYVPDIDAVYWKDLYECENSCAGMILAMKEAGALIKISGTEADYYIDQKEKENGDELADEQRLAVKTALTNGVSIITGGPGRGKTKIVQYIVGGRGTNNVVLCAPTGRAAQHMSDQTGLPADTVMGLYFKHLRDHIKQKLVIIDESSMLDLRLITDFLGVMDNCNVVFVGDKDQLPPIGAGYFFKDMIRSGAVPTVTLVKSYRNSGAIAFNADVVNAGGTIGTFRSDNLFDFMPCSKDEAAQKVIDTYKAFYGHKEITKKDPATGKQIKALCTADDICVLAPMKARGSVCVNKLNETLRALVNPGWERLPHMKGQGGQILAINDRVMVMKNHKAEGVFNGNCGRLKDINAAEKWFVIQMDAGQQVKLPLDIASDVSLAYAMTVHKSQGSEYPVVIMALTSEHFIMLKRNLLYTGITRASKHMTLIGDPKFIQIAINTIDNVMRNTTLKQKLTGVL